MSFLTNLRVLTKILAIIMLLSAVTIGVTVLAIVSLKSLSQDTDVMKTAATDALDASKIDQSVIEINRAEYRIGSDPRAENVAASRKVIDEQVKRLNRLVEDVSKTIGPAGAEVSRHREGDAEEIYPRDRRHLQSRGSGQELPDDHGTRAPARPDRRQPRNG